MSKYKVLSRRFSNWSGLRKTRFGMCASLLSWHVLPWSCDAAVRCQSHFPGWMFPLGFSSLRTLLASTSRSHVSFRIPFPVTCDHTEPEDGLFQPAKLRFSLYAIFNASWFSPQYCLLHFLPWHFIHFDIFTMIFFHLPIFWCWSIKKIDYF